MKNVKIATLLLTIGTLGMAACGNTQGPASNKIKIDFWHTFGDKPETALKNKADEFIKLVKENEGVDLEFDIYHYGNYTDTVTQIGTALAGGNGPTMMISYPDSVAAIMKRYPKAIVKLDDYFTNSEYGFGKDRYLDDVAVGTSDFIQSYIQEGQQFQTPGTYVMPYMKSSEIMLYNVEAVTEVMKIYRPDLTGSEVTEFIETMSFDQLMEIAKVAYDHQAELGITFDKDDKSFPVFYDSDSNMLITQLEQKGLKYSYLDNSGNVVLGLDKAANQENYNAAVELLTKYQEWHDGGLLTTKATENGYASDSFKNKKCLFTIGSSGGAGYSFPQAGQFTCGVCRVPYAGTNSNNPKYISQGPSISFLNDSSKSDELNATTLKYAWKFYKYITNTDNNVEVCVNGSEGYIPVRNSCYQSEYWAEFLENDNDYTRSAQVLRNKVGDNFISSLVFNGSAEYRNQMTGLVSAVLTHKGAIGALVDTAVSNTKNAM